MDQRFSNWRHPHIRENVPTSWNWIVQYVDNFKMGIDTDIGAFTYINAKHGVIIEDHVQIGSHCAIYSESTIDGKEGSVHIKKGAKIGSHSVVLPGVRIGENTIVGACSLVLHDLPDNVTAFGIPARVAESKDDEQHKDSPI